MAKNEEITDLTGTEESTPVKGAKPKREKKAKNAIVDKGDKGKDDGNGKAKRKRVKLLIIICAVLILIGGVVAILYRDEFGARTTVITLVNRLDPEFVELERRIINFNIDSREIIETLEQRERELDQWESELELANSTLVLNRNDLADREHNLRMREEMLHPILIRIEENAHIYSLARVYAHMAPLAAAQRLSEIEDRYYAATILFVMEETSKALVLAQMDPDLAARLTEILMFMSD